MKPEISKLPEDFDINYYLGPVEYHYFYEQDLEVYKTGLNVGDNFFYKDTETKTIHQVRVERAVQVRVMSFSYNH